MFILQNINSILCNLFSCKSLGKPQIDRYMCAYFTYMDSRLRYTPWSAPPKVFSCSLPLGNSYSDLCQYRLVLPVLELDVNEIL